MLDNQQIGLIEQVIRARLDENDVQPFDRFLHHINTVMLNAERGDIERTKEWLFKHSSKYPSERIKFETYNQVKGELELLLGAIFEAANKGKVDATYNLVFRLQGTYWERVFCRRFGIETQEWGYVYRPQKWHPLGAATLAPGIDKVEPRRITLPDMICMLKGVWVLGEVKHETLTKKKHGSIEAGCYGLPQTDWWRIKKLLRLKPLIPYWFIIHEHKRLGRWNIDDQLCDWLVGDFRALGEPITTPSLSGDTSDWSGMFVRDMCYWRFEGDNFIGLDKALEKLDNATQS